MASYRRFVAYVYRYQNGRKGDNCGFVKVEARNGLCTFYLRLQGIRVSGTAQVFAFVRKADGEDFIPIGPVEVKDGMLHQRLDTDRLHMGGSAYTLEQCNGLLCVGENMEYYGTVWDDSNVVPRWDTALVQKSRTEEEQARNPEDKTEVVADVGRTAEPIIEVELEKMPDQETVLEPIAAVEPESVPESIVEVERESVPEPIVEIGAENVPESIVEVERESVPEAIVEMERENEPERTDGVEPEGMTEPIDQVESDGACGSLVGMESEKEVDSIVKAHAQESHKSGQEQSPQEKNVEMTGMTAREQPEIADRRRPAKTFGEMWAYMQQEYPRLEPFEDGGIVEGIKIAPSDIPYLQERNWNLGNNRFLLHGYKSYHHLLLGRVEGQRCYVLGVPGVFDQQEQFMAKMFGFPQFKPIRQCRNRIGQFGYWFRCIG